jgi:hypothetical protein
MSGRNDGSDLCGGGEAIQWKPNSPSPLQCKQRENKELEVPDEELDKTEPSMAPIAPWELRE